MKKTVVHSSEGRRITATTASRQRDEINETDGVSTVSGSGSSSSTTFRKQSDSRRRAQAHRNQTTHRQQLHCGRVPDRSKQTELPAPPER